MVNFSRIIIYFFLSFFILINISVAQPKPIMNSSELHLAIKKLNVLGSVLYIAAHPDDENTAVLSYFSSGELVETGYLALTRGDGGQNLIGSEQAELLGVIRTQELLRARKIDGAKQFFTRAVDFGYSKSPDETLEIWDREKILSDVVWVIRKFKPDVILTRFSPDHYGGHGHHTASAILAKEAFNIAGDKNKFPEQLEFVEPWQPKRIYWNAWQGAVSNFDSSLVVSINTGNYNTFLGKSYTEISAESRTMHKSQGFGSSGRRGEVTDFFVYLDGDTASSDLLEDVDMSWNKIENGIKISEMLNEAYNLFKPEEPYKSVPLLVKIYKELSAISSHHWVEIKKKELSEIIRSAAGIWIEAVAPDFSASPGDTFTISAGIVNRSPLSFTLKNIGINYQIYDSLYNKNLTKGKFYEFKIFIKLPDNISYTQPYWLKEESFKGTYIVDDQRLIGKPENEPPIAAEFILNFNGINIPVSTSLYYRWNDPVNGEQYRPFELVPPVAINFANNLYIFPDSIEKEISIKLKSNSNNVNGSLEINQPENWRISPSKVDFIFKEKNEEVVYKFKVLPPQNISEVNLTAKAVTNKGEVTNGIISLNYSHFPVQTVFPAARTKLLKLNSEKIIYNIGYIMGSGDDIPFYLEQLGYNVQVLNNGILESGDLSHYDVIITGIRAYNTVERLAIIQPHLLSYVKNGGTLVVQYNTSNRLATGNVGPFPFNISRERVTDENSEVKFLKPDHILLNHPNKITQDDFKGWIQERGLYFADEWDSNYETVIASKDAGEDLQEGGILYAKYGKGNFIYTGYSFFRQLPAGIPGAYRFFTNLISSGKINQGVQ